MPNYTEPEKTNPTLTEPEKTNPTHIEPSKTDVVYHEPSAKGWFSSGWFSDKWFSKGKGEPSYTEPEKSDITYDEPEKSEWIGVDMHNKLHPNKGVYKKGHIVTMKVRNKISESLKGWVSHRKGKYISEEHKRKISESLKGENNPSYGKHWSEKHKNKTSESLKGNIISKETRRKISEANRGEKHHNWRGGISFEPYNLDWTETLRRSIRERDKYTCQLCGKLQSDRAIDVHHIDYNKKNCNPDNLITLCNNCHIKTNYKRNYWIEYFKLKKGEWYEKNIISIIFN